MTEHTCNKSYPSVYFITDIESCPNESKENEDYCIFHQPVEQKNDEEVSSRLSDMIKNANENETIHLEGAKFGKLDLKNISKCPTINFSKAEFNESVDFSGVEFNGYAKFSDVEFNNRADFVKAQFNEGVNFDAAKFNDHTDFDDAKFNGFAKFTKIDFNGHTIFNNVEFNEGTAFRDTDFYNTVRFKSAEFNGESDFRYVQFKGTTDFRESRLKNIRFKNVDLRGANFESAILDQAELFDADLRGAKLGGVVFGDSRINEETQFLGSPSYVVYDKKYRGEHNISSNKNKAKRVYKSLEKLGRRSGVTSLQSKAFVRRKDVQKRIYKERAREGNLSLMSISNWGKYFQELISRHVLLYGESPIRSIIWGFIAILGFTFLYPLGGWLRPVGGNPITYGRIFENPTLLFDSLYFSTLTFTTLGFGEYELVGTGGHLIVILNIFLGTILIALLVFILGKKSAK